MFKRMRLGMVLFLVIVLTAIVPLIIVAVSVGMFLNGTIADITNKVQATYGQMSADIIGKNLQGEAESAAEGIDRLMKERVHDVREWVRSPLIIQGAVAAGKKAQDEGLMSLSLEELEKRREGNRALLLQDTAFMAYIADLVKNNPSFSEVFFTESHGYIAAYSEETSDFVQSDEDWWTTAWEKGSYVGPVQYDESARVYSVEIAVQIKDGSGNPVGVMKGVINVSAVQELAEKTSQRTEQSTMRIFLADGNLIADTESGNDPAIIMKAEGNLINRGWTTAQEVIKQNGSGYVLDQPSLSTGKAVNGKENTIALGYAKMAGGDYYNLPGFDGFKWYVTVEQPNQVALLPLSGLTLMLQDLESRLRVVLQILLGCVLASGLLAALMAWASSRQIVKPLAALSDASQKFSSGDMDVLVSPTSSNEIGDLETAFARMISQIREMVRKERSEREYMESAVRRYLTFMQQVSAGNLNLHPELDGANRPADDPLIRLGKDLDAMTCNLHGTITQIRDVSASLASAANEILAATTQQASGASEQSAAISETTTTVDEVRAIAEQSSRRAQEVAEMAQRTMSVSQTGQQAMNEMLRSMAQIKDRVEKIAENILALSEQTQQIGEIITTVNEISSQSNMLALNASVESARAGEHGAGFAVVASEMRSLAEQSKQATGQVKGILSQIQQATNATVMATEEGTKGVDKGVLLVSEVKQSIEKLSQVIAESDRVALQVVAAGQQQVTGVEQVSMAMQNINQATIQSLLSTREAEKAAQNLSELAQRLNDMVVRYRV